MVLTIPGCRPINSFVAQITDSHFILSTKGGSVGTVREPCSSQVPPPVWLPQLGGKAGAAATCSQNEKFVTIQFLHDVQTLCVVEVF